MSEFVNVPEFFTSVYLVDFSPSLCEVARKRFARLGWSNVKVICMDARKFRLEDYENGPSRGGQSSPAQRSRSYFEPRPDHGGADLVTMSYSLSMIVGCTQRGRRGRATIAAAATKQQLTSCSPTTTPSLIRLPRFSPTMVSWVSLTSTSSPRWM